MVRARYGAFQVLVDGDVVIDGGATALLGVLPGVENIVEAVRVRLRERPTDVTADGSSLPPAR